MLHVVNQKAGYIIPKRFVRINDIGELIIDINTFKNYFKYAYELIKTIMTEEQTINTDGLITFINSFNKPNLVIDDIINFMDVFYNPLINFNKLVKDTNNYVKILIDDTNVILSGRIDTAKTHASYIVYRNNNYVVERVMPSKSEDKSNPYAFTSTQLTDIGIRNDISSTKIYGIINNMYNSDNYTNISIINGLVLTKNNFISYIKKFIPANKDIEYLLDIFFNQNNEITAQYNAVKYMVESNTIDILFSILRDEQNTQMMQSLFANVNYDTKRELYNKLTIMTHDNMDEQMLLFMEKMNNYIDDENRDKIAKCVNVFSLSDSFNKLKRTTNTDIIYNIINDIKSRVDIKLLEYEPLVEALVNNINVMKHINPIIKNEIIVNDTDVQLFNKFLVTLGKYLNNSKDPQIKNKAKLIFYVLYLHVNDEINISGTKLKNIFDFIIRTYYNMFYEFSDKVNNDQAYKNMKKNDASKQEELWVITLFDSVNWNMHDIDDLNEQFELIINNYLSSNYNLLIIFSNHLNYFLDNENKQEMDQIVFEFNALERKYEKKGKNIEISKDITDIIFNKVMLDEYPDKNNKLLAILRSILGKLDLSYDINLDKLILDVNNFNEHVEKNLNEYYFDFLKELYKILYYISKVNTLFEGEQNLRIGDNIFMVYFSQLMESNIQFVSKRSIMGKLLKIHPYNITEINDDNSYGAEFLLQRYLFTPYTTVGYKRVNNEIPDCMESAMRDFINVLIFDNDQININKLPSTTLPSVKAFYSKYNTLYKQHKLNRDDDNNLRLEWLSILNIDIYKILKTKYPDVDMESFFNYYRNYYVVDIKSCMYNFTIFITIMLGIDADIELNYTEENKDKISQTLSDIIKLFYDNSSINFLNDIVNTMTLSIDNAHEFRIYDGHSKMIKRESFQYSSFIKEISKVTDKLNNTLFFTFLDAPNFLTNTLYQENSFIVHNETTGQSKKYAPMEYLLIIFNLLNEQNARFIMDEMSEIVLDYVMEYNLNDIFYGSYFFKSIPQSIYYRKYLENTIHLTVKLPSTQDYYVVSPNESVSLDDIIHIFNDYVGGNIKMALEKNREKFVKDILILNNEKNNIAKLFNVLELLKYNEESKDIYDMFIDVFNNCNCEITIDIGKLIANPYNNYKLVKGKKNRVIHDYEDYKIYDVTLKTNNIKIKYLKLNKKAISACIRHFDNFNTVTEINRTQLANMKLLLSSVFNFDNSTIVLKEFILYQLPARYYFILLDDGTTFNDPHNIIPLIDVYSTKDDPIKKDFKNMEMYQHNIRYRAKMKNYCKNVLGTINNIINNLEQTGGKYKSMYQQYLRKIK